MKNTPYFKITQIADRYSLTRQAVYKWIRLGKLRKPRIHPVDGARYWLESDLPPLGERAAPPKGDPLPECNCDPMDGEPFDCICPTEEAVLAAHQ